jgi:hypothetical protein
MNHEQTSEINHKRSSNRRKDKTTARPVTELRGMDKTAKGCKRNNKRQKELSSSFSITDGFLRNVFTPKLKADNTNKMNTAADQITLDFYRSLELVSAYYKLNLKNPKAIPYPYNISTTMRELESKLKTRLKNYEDIRLVQEQGKTYLIIEDSFYTNMNLFYIPVIPLYRVMQKKEKRTMADLILSIFSYLYNVAKIPYYRDKKSYLYWNYQTIKGWLKEEGEMEMASELQEISDAKTIGNYMLNEIKSPKHLRNFKKRINDFNPADDFEAECLSVAKQTLKIYTEFPKEQITRNVKELRNLNADDNMATIEQYVGFCADSDGYVHDQLLDCVDSELQEYDLQEPITQKKFDGSEIVEKEESFEYRIFDLLASVCTIAYNL